MRTIVAALVATPLAWLAGVSALILHEEPSARPASAAAIASADVAIVLGAAVQRDGTPSPVLAGRLEHGVALFKRGAVGTLLLTGGRGEGQPVAEAVAARTYAARRGVPAEAMLVEDRSRTTRQNMAEARRLMDGAGLRTALLVSDPLHLPRALRMARAAGIDARPSPTPSSRYRSWRARAWFLLREAFFLTGFWVTGR